MKSSPRCCVCARRKRYPGKWQRVVNDGQAILKYAEASCAFCAAALVRSYHQKIVLDIDGDTVNMLYHYHWSLGFSNRLSLIGHPSAQLGLELGVSEICQ